MKVTYEEMEALLESKKEFAGNSVTARWEDKEYVIKSYDTVIFRTDKKDSIIYFDGRKHSTTTSRIQNMIRKIFDIK